MDRRESIKSLLLGSVAGGLVIHGCTPGMETTATESELAFSKAAALNYGRTPEEIAHIADLYAEQFFNEHEMATLAVLCDLILPANTTHGSASSVGVPDFIDFMAKDYPDFQLPLRGGLMWLDHESNTRYQKVFKDGAADEQKAILDEIAFHDPEVSLQEQAAELQFFVLLRNLTLTGYYTTKEGIEDLGYKGNSPNVWDGVPEDVLQKHGLAYEEEWLAKCVDQSQRDVVAEWDDEGNLLT